MGRQIRSVAPIGNNFFHREVERNPSRSIDSDIFRRWESRTPGNHLSRMCENGVNITIQIRFKSHSPVGIAGIDIACWPSFRVRPEFFCEAPGRKRLTLTHTNQCNSIRNRDFAMRSCDFHRLFRRDFRRCSGNSGQTNILPFECSKNRAEWRPDAGLPARPEAEWVRGNDGNRFIGPGKPQPSSRR
jgi:hypothetical protein